MFYKRPSLRRGGMPTGIDTLSPRVQAQSGFFGQTPLFFRDSKQIGLDFPSTITSMQMPTAFQEKVMMKSFPMNASEMGVASVAKEKPISNTQKLDQEMNEMIEIGGYGTIPKGPETDLSKLSDTMLKIMGTAETRAELEKRKKSETIDKSETSDDGFLPNAGPKPVNFDKIAADVITDKDVKSKDTETGGETVEDSFDSEYDKQMRRLEKYLGSTNRETKGKVALALSDAVGTPGSIADKAAVLNKSLLGILGERKKDKKELAKIAFAATSELEKARILAEKPSEYEKRRNRYITLKNKKELSDEEKTELTALTSELGLDKKSDKLSLTDAGRLTEMLGDITANIDDYEKEKDPALKAELEAEIRNAVLNVLQAKGVNQTIILSQEPRIKGFLKLADGGRVNKAMGGGASETPAEPVATNLTFEQLRTRLPKEITDDIVRLVATSEEALQDFAYIRTQGDVEKFNVKYGVNLVLPQDTA